MVLARWDPFKDLVALHERMNRLFEESLSLSRRIETKPAGSWSPLVDIYETQTDIVLKVDLPGVEEKDIELDAHDNTLFLRGERRLPKNFTDGNYHRMERSYGTFQRSFTIPNVGQRDNFKVTFQEGVLEIVIPKKLL
jgi:HSP20 family protein